MKVGLPRRHAGHWDHVLPFWVHLQLEVPLAAILHDARLEVDAELHGDGRMEQRVALGVFGEAQGLLLRGKLVQGHLPLEYFVDELVVPFPPLRRDALL